MKKYLRNKKYVKSIKDEIKELSRDRHNFYDKLELYEIFCQTVKYITVEEKGTFRATDPSTSDPSTLRGHVWASIESERVL